jgi:dihydroorotate dehydrogenase
MGAWGTWGMRQLPAEVAHELTVKFLEWGGLRFFMRPNLHPQVAGLTMNVPSIGQLPHPIGLAAGMDKNCQAPMGFADMGFAFLEMGTVTPRPQPGNPKPRLWRLKSQLALVNRMGFNNEGTKKIAERLKSQHWDHRATPLGINLGKNKDTPIERALDDYLCGIAEFAELSRYLVINISSPNTPGLRALAEKSFLQELARGAGSSLDKLWIKLDPDMTRRKFQEVIATVSECGFRGIILSNTHKVSYPYEGGVSGHPVFALANSCLEWAHEVHKGTLPTIASGGILCGADILQKIMRGALAVQILTALVYRGPWAVFELLRELTEELKLRGFSRLQDAVGTYYEGES